MLAPALSVRLYLQLRQEPEEHVRSNFIIISCFVWNLSTIGYSGYALNVSALHPCPIQSHSVFSSEERLTSRTRTRAPGPVEHRRCVV